MVKQTVSLYQIGQVGIPAIALFFSHVPALAELPLDQQAQEVVQRLTGKMDTTRQAASNPKVAKVQMTTCLLQQPEANQSRFLLYQEQALLEDLSKPYRQRFLEISPQPFSQTVRSRAFKPTNPTAFVNFCDRPLVQRVFSPQDLGEAVCSVFLKRVGEDYVGVTPVTGCPANVRGAVRITNQITLRKDEMDTWDRGFDAKGKQVWGAQSEAYQFRRTVTPEP
ncbi:MAG TPA: chromophore lyase CpcT/CpeT [Leptolyngbyaceae cyanobacterium M33_DOE_097]|uniref:Chorismate mutase n=1 Tax=Oscillatoriales cyanobacterium SpSt-418 TaxID=2282169 RepID=A0A7C3PSJ0_9CYAN|nr:chromophore lyase CpcT/CpeT [Leptolyngbyaceae cyanobacterium M33_DOE_097]